MPPIPHHSTRQLALLSRDIAVYDLTHLAHSEQIRWRTQYCLTHAAFTAALDLALAEWEPFDSFLHHAFTAIRLPVNLRPHH
ncbi:hypothetical protein [Streptomyces hydrogenans]|uniref:hypothetical protein n=1 Tax=Streptomyces hydrogenans TaxID=1873719 RepID=UPI0035E34279